MNLKNNHKLEDSSLINKDNINNANTSQQTIEALSSKSNLYNTNSNNNNNDINSSCNTTLFKIEDDNYKLNLIIFKEIQPYLINTSYSFVENKVSNKQIL